MKQKQSTILHRAAATLLAVVMLTAAQTARAKTSDTMGNGISWEYTDNNNTLTFTYTGSGSGVMPDYQSTSSTKDWPISNIKHLVIGNGITHIGNYMFCNHTALEDVTFQGTTLTTIGKYAFYNCNCTSLTSITLPEGVTSIGQGAFQDCSYLTSVTLPESLTNLTNNSFYGCI